MNDLIERLENVTGPDRGIDRAIAVVVGWHRIEPRYARSRHGGWISPEDWIGENGGYPILDSLHGTTIYRDVPAYTASLDAAMGLMPEDFKRWWKLGCGLTGEYSTCLRYYHGLLLSTLDYIEAIGRGKTREASMCIACLRALNELKVMAGGTIRETTTRTPTRTPNADEPQATEPQR